MSFIVMRHSQDISDVDDLNKIRSMTGVCPQQSILFKELSCGEHLELFAKLKGVPKQSVNDEVWHTFFLDMKLNILKIKIRPKLDNEFEKCCKPSRPSWATGFLRSRYVTVEQVSCK